MLGSFNAYFAWAPLLFIFTILTRQSFALQFSFRGPRAVGEQLTLEWRLDNNEPESFAFRTLFKGTDGFQQVSSNAIRAQGRSGQVSLTFSEAGIHQVLAFRDPAEIDQGKAFAGSNELTIGPNSSGSTSRNEGTANSDRATSSRSSVGATNSSQAPSTTSRTTSTRSSVGATNSSQAPSTTSRPTLTSTGSQSSQTNKSSSDSSPTASDSTSSTTTSPTDSVTSATASVSDAEDNRVLVNVLVASGVFIILVIVVTTCFLKQRRAKRPSPDTLPRPHTDLEAGLPTLGYRETKKKTEEMTPVEEQPDQGATFTLTGLHNAIQSSNERAETLQAEVHRLSEALRMQHGSDRPPSYGNSVPLGVGATSQV